MRCALIDALCRAAYRTGDSERTSWLKRLNLSLATAGILSQGTMLVLVAGLFRNALGLAVATLSSILVMAVTLLCDVDPAKVTVYGAFLWSIGVAFGDLVQSVNGAERYWTLLVVALDLMLVVGANVREQRALVACTVLYLLYERIETGARFGVSKALTHDGDLPLKCDCADPPCATGVGAGVVTWVPWCALFVSDYMITRGFADAMRRQMSIVQRSVEVCSVVAAKLSEYKVEEAATHVDEHEAQLPPDLYHTFIVLLANLRAYRPFLPDALLMPTSRRSTAHMFGDSPPGSPPSAAPPECVDGKARLCVCFTDIQSSTVLWERHPQGMFEGLRLHNATMRAVAAETGGYEVKIIGDAFMLVFQEAINGLRFALEAQNRLMKVEWPRDLTQHELCALTVAPDGGMLWHGPRVRIGLHCGEVNVDHNPVTGRFDFFSPVVNTASRVEAELRNGGLVGVTDEVMRAVGTDGLASLKNPVLLPLGQRRVRGVAEPVSITVLLPQRLAGRAEVVGLDMHARYDHHMKSEPSEAQVAWVDPPKRLPARLNAVGLIRSRLTAATVRVALPKCATQEEGMVAVLSACEQAADVTQGVLSSVLSGSMCVSWNAAQSCPDHVQQCMNFAGRMQLCRVPHFSIGVAGGSGVHGTIAGVRRKHSTVIAGCVELSVALAEAAEMEGVEVLACGQFAEYAHVGGVGQRLQLWRSRSASHVVWAVRPKLITKGADSSTMADSSHTVTVDSGESQEQQAERAFVTAAETGDMSAVVQLADAGTQSLQLVAGRESVAVRWMPDLDVQASTQFCRPLAGAVEEGPLAGGR